MRKPAQHFRGRAPSPPEVWRERSNHLVNERTSFAGPKTVIKVVDSSTQIQLLNHIRDSHFG